MSIFQTKINQYIKNIWRYAAYYPPVKTEYRLSLDEGNTPEIMAPEIAKSLGLNDLIFKCEDQNPNGSHKDRGLAYQISRAYEEGRKNLIISSSGNGAISAAAYCRNAGIKLFVFVSFKIERAKLEKIIEQNPAMIFTSLKPLTFSDYISKKYDIKNIKSSADENSIYGYKSIGFEIYERQGEADSIFLAVSSGMTMLGIAAAYQDLLALGEIKKMPQFHIVQPSRIHPLAAHFDKDFKYESEVLAKAIVNRNVLKEKEIISAITQSGGGGWIVQNSAIKEATELLKNNGIETSYEGAAALAGIFKARNKGFNIGKRTVCLLTGRVYVDTEKLNTLPREKLMLIENTAQLDEYFGKNI